MYVLRMYAVCCSSSFLFYCMQYVVYVRSLCYVELDFSFSLKIPDIRIQSVIIVKEYFIRSVYGSFCLTNMVQLERTFVHFRFKKLNLMYFKSIFELCFGSSQLIPMSYFFFLRGLFLNNYYVLIIQLIESVNNILSHMIIFILFILKYISQKLLNCCCIFL